MRTTSKLGVLEIEMFISSCYVPDKVEYVSGNLSLVDLQPTKRADLLAESVILRVTLIWKKQVLKVRPLLNIAGIILLLSNLDEKFFFGESQKKNISDRFNYLSFFANYFANNFGGSNNL